MVYSLGTIGTSFLFASEGKALILNGICVGLLPKILRREEFHSKLMLIIGGALVSQTLSMTLKGRYSVTLQGLASQMVTQIVLAYIFSARARGGSPAEGQEDVNSPPPSKQQPRHPIDYGKLKEENYLNSNMSGQAGEMLHEATESFDLLFNPGSVYRERYQTTIAVCPEDCLTVAKKLTQEGCLTAVVNFASTREFGGGFTEGKKGSQEEEICYRSTLGALADYHLFNPNNKMSLAETTGALNNPNSDRPTKVLWTPNVVVFRDENYDLIESSFIVGVLSCAALVRMNKAGAPYNEKERKLMKALIRTQLDVAHRKGCTAFVSGAFGCGKFGNPPGEVAELYREVITQEFKDAFRYVAFAILPDAYDQSKNNFTPFQTVFQSPIETPQPYSQVAHSPPLHDQSQWRVGRVRRRHVAQEVVDST